MLLTCCIGFVSLSGFSRYKTSSPTSCAWLETFHQLSRVCSPRWMLPLPALIRTSSSFISKSLKQRLHQSWHQSVNRESSAVLVQRGSLFKVQQRCFVFWGVGSYQVQKWPKSVLCSCLIFLSVTVIITKYSVESALLKPFMSSLHIPSFNCASTYTSIEMSHTQ